MTERLHIFERSPHIFRLFFLAVAIPLIGMSALHVYYLVNAGSPENYYQSTDGSVYVGENIPVSRLTSSTALSHILPFGQNDPTNLIVGDILIDLEGIPITSHGQLLTLLENYKTNTLVTVKVQRTTRHQHELNFQVPVIGLRDAQLWDLPPTVFAFNVPKGGASDRAGMKPGDLIFEINGKNFADREQADREIAKTLRGQAITFGVLRAGQHLTIKVTMAQLTIELPLLAYLAVGLLWLSTALFLGIFRSHLKAARLLSMGLLFLAISFVLYEDRFQFNSAFLDTWPRVVGNFTLFFGLAILIHTSYHFPRESLRLLRVKQWRYLGYSIAIPASLISLFFGKIGFALALLAMVVPQLWIRFQYDHRSRERSHMERYIINGASYGLVSIIGWSFLHHHMTPNADQLVRALTAFIVISSYLLTIAKYRLLGIEIRRSLQYAIISLILGIVVIASVLLYLNILAESDLNYLNVRLSTSDIEFHNTALSPEHQLRNHKMTIMLLAIMGGWVLNRMGRRAHRVLRRRFYRDSQDYLKVSDELISVLNGNLGILQLARHLADVLTRLMLVKGVGVLIFRDEKEACAVATNGLYNPDDFEAFCARHTPKLVNILKKFPSELSTDYLSSDLKEEFLIRRIHYIYPIYSKETLMGALLVGEKLSEAAYRPRDFRFLSATARQAAVAVENAFLYEQVTEGERFRHELELARQIQLSSLPQEEPEVPGLDVAGSSLPALEVGGDYYAYFPGQDGSLTLVLGDVSGKGTSAALYMSKMQGIFASLHHESLSPRQLFVKANAVLYREIERQAFITASCARINPSTMTLDLARAGHLPLFHYRARENDVIAHSPKGLALGVDKGPLLEKLLDEGSTSYGPGDVFLFLSDGITEMVDANRQLYGEDRVAESLKECAWRNATGIRNQILAEVGSFAGDGELQDDQTVVVIKAVRVSPE